MLEFLANQQRFNRPLRDIYVTLDFYAVFASTIFRNLPVIRLENRLDGNGHRLSGHRLHYFPA